MASSFLQWKTSARRAALGGHPWRVRPEAVAGIAAAAAAAAAVHSYDVRDLARAEVRLLVAGTT